MLSGGGGRRRPPRERVGRLAHSHGTGPVRQTQSQFTRGARRAAAAPPPSHHRASGAHRWTKGRGPSCMGFSEMSHSMNIHVSHPLRLIDWIRWGDRLYLTALLAERILRVCRRGPVHHGSSHRGKAVQSANEARPPRGHRLARGSHASSANSGAVLYTSTVQRSVGGKKASQAVRQAIFAEAVWGGRARGKPVAAHGQTAGPNSPRARRMAVAAPAAPGGCRTGSTPPCAVAPGHVDDSQWGGG